MSNIAQAWAWSVPVGGVTKLVLVALADHSDDDGVCWPGVRGIAKKCGIVERTVERNIAQLTEDGWLSVKARYRDDGSKTSNLYTLNLTVDGDNLSGGGDSAPPPLPSESRQVASEKGGLEPPINHQLEPSVLYTQGSNGQKSLAEDTTVWPDWYATLWAIPGFKVPLDHAQAWLDDKKISTDHAETTAYALKSKWPGPPKNPYRDPWATFQHWVKRPPLSDNGAERGSHGKPRLNIGSPDQYAQARAEQQRRRADAGDGQRALMR